MTIIVVRARIDSHIKEEAAAVPAAIGLSTSDAFRMLLIRVAKEKKLPFEPLIPNKTTIEAMKSARRGEMRKISGLHTLIDELNVDN